MHAELPAKYIARDNIASLGVVDIALAYPLTISRLSPKKYSNRSLGVVLDSKRGIAAHVT